MAFTNVVKLLTSNVGIGLKYLKEKDNPRAHRTTKSKRFARETVSYLREFMRDHLTFIRAGLRTDYVYHRSI